MTAIWIALGAVAIALIPAFMSLNAAEAKRKKEGGDGGGDGGGGD